MAALATKSQISTSTELLVCKIDQDGAEELSREDVSEYSYGIAVQVMWICVILEPYTGA